MIRTCSHCGAKNRIPPKHLASQGRCGKCRQSFGPLAVPLDVTAAEFDAIVGASTVPVLVDFWASWCGPCQQAAPELKKVAHELAGRCIVLKVNTEQEQALAARYAVRSIPYFAVFERGQLVRDQAGLVPASHLKVLALGA